MNIIIYNQYFFGQHYPFKKKKSVTDSQILCIVYLSLFSVEFSNITIIEKYHQSPSFKHVLFAFEIRKFSSKA